MRWRSKKAAQRAKESKPIRDSLIAAAKECMICGASPRKPKHPMTQLNQLCCHEISNGPLRQSLWTSLTASWFCVFIAISASWDKPLAQSRQLAVLMQKSPENYDLVAFNHLVNPSIRHDEQHEVDAWLES